MAGEAGEGMEKERKKPSRFLEANKCPQKSGCKQSPRDLERNPNRVPNANSFVQQTAGKPQPRACPGKARDKGTF